MLSGNHLTIRDVRQQFKESNNIQEKSFAKVVSATTNGSISKSEYETVIQNMSAQFTTMVQTLVVEVQRSTYEMVGSVTQALFAITQEIQSIKPSKTHLTALQDYLARKAKKLKAFDRSS